MNYSTITSDKNWLPNCVFISHAKNSTISRRRVMSCYYFACKNQKYVLVLCTLKLKAGPCGPSWLRSYQWVSEQESVFMIAFISMISRVFTIVFIRKIYSLTIMSLVMQFLIKINLHNVYRKQDYISAIMPLLCM